MRTVQTQVTLTLDSEVVRRAKELAARRGKSLSEIVAEALGEPEESIVRANAGSSTGISGKAPTPITDRLAGILKGHRADAEDYHRHLERKHLCD
jgi:hypothetical protein